MKAADYVWHFEKEGKTAEALMSVKTNMLREVRQICRTRGVCTDGAVLAVFEEIDQKFQSFRKNAGCLANGTLIQKDELRIMLKKADERMFKKWDRRRGGKLIEA